MSKNRDDVLNELFASNDEIGDEAGTPSSDEENDEDTEPDNPTESSSSQPVKDVSTKRRTSAQRTNKKQTAADDRSGVT